MRAGVWVAAGDLLGAAGLGGMTDGDPFWCLPFLVPLGGLIIDGFALSFSCRCFGLLSFHMFSSPFAEFIVSVIGHHLTPLSRRDTSEIAQATVAIPHMNEDSGG